MPREHPLSWHRVVPLALVGILAVLAAAALRGPEWYRRMYYPIEYQGVIERVARAEQVDPYLVTAIVHAESGFDADIVSKKGAVGLMQVMPETAEEVGRKTSESTPVVTAAQLRQPETNVRVGIEYLKQLLRRYHGDRKLALAAYNAGIANADRWKREGAQEIDFPQTRHYVDKVLTERETYKKLYPEAYPWQKQ